MHGSAELHQRRALDPEPTHPARSASRWRPDGRTATERSVELAADAASDNVVVARLTGLAPGSRAALPGRRAAAIAREGTVRAQP